MIARRLLVPMVLVAVAAQSGAAFAQGAFPAVSPGQSSGAAPRFPSVGAAPAPEASQKSSEASQSSPFPRVGGAAGPSEAGPAASFPPVSGTKASLPSVVLPPQGTTLPGFGGVAPPAAGGGAQQECLSQADPLREETQRRAKLVQAAGERHAPPQEACKLLRNFSEAEVRFLNFVMTKQTACNIPADIPKGMKKAHARTEAIVKQVCSAGTAAQAPSGPSLSDVIGSPAVLEEPTTKRKGGSTFDTLNGNVLGR